MRIYGLTIARCTYSQVMSVSQQPVSGQNTRSIVFQILVSTSTSRLAIQLFRQVDNSSNVKSFRVCSHVNVKNVESLTSKLGHPREAAHFSYHL